MHPNDMLIIRMYQPGDDQHIEAICFETALYGAPIEGLFADRKLVGMTLLSYFRDYEPHHFLVAEIGGRTAGYLTACADVRRYERLLVRRIVPRLAREFVIGGHWLRLAAWRFAARLWRTAVCCGARDKRCSTFIPPRCISILPRRTANAELAQRSSRGPYSRCTRRR